MFRSTLIVSFFSALGAGVSFLNQLILARYFGTSVEMDAYLIAFSVPITISGLLSGVLNYQLVPALQRAESSRRGGTGLIRALLAGLGGGSAFVALVGVLTADWIVTTLNPTLPVPVHFLAVRLAHFSWICVPLSVLGSIYTAGLHVRQRFFAATGLISAPIMGSMISCLLFHTRLGIIAIVWGQLVGYVAMLGGLRFAYGRTPLGFDWGGVRRIFMEFPSALAAVLIFVLYPFSDAIWGSRVGPSAVSYLGYAQRLLVGFSGLAVVGLTTVLFPRLARHAAEGRGDALRQELGASIRIMLICMVPGAAIFGQLATPSLQILFQRGSFRLTDAIALGRLLPVMLGGMVAMSCAGLVFKALFASGDAKFACILSVVGSFLYFILSGFLSGWLGVEGIGMAYTVTWWLVLGFGVRFIWRESPVVGLILDWLRFVCHLGVATLIVAVLCRLGTQFLPVETSSDYTARLLVVAGIWTLGLVSYFSVAAFFPELSEVRAITQKISAFALSKFSTPK